MPSLHELQQRMGRVLRDEADAGLLAGCIADGRVPLRQRLAVHRNTVRGALCQALRLRHPTVERLVGAAFFDQAVLAFARGAWPEAPQLGAWGQGFAAFLDRYAPASDLAYLHDVARFDALLDGLSALPGDGERARWPAHALAPGVQLALAPSLRVFRGDFPVDDIRAAVLAGDDAALARIDLQPRSLRLAAWRDGAALKTRRLGSIAARFLEALCAGGEPAAALAAAASPGLSEADVVAAVQREVLPAPFVALRAEAARLPTDANRMPA
jgi:hypothetical protein